MAGPEGTEPSGRIGALAIIISALVAAVLAFMATDREGAINSLSLTAASVAYTLMALNLLLATRLAFLEPLFGGLDRVYFVHKWTGVAALGFLLVHYFNKPNFQGIVFNAAGHILAGTAGKIAFYGLVLLILISFFKRLPRLKLELPYHIWRWTHRLMGLGFTLVVFHQFYIKRPFSGAEGLAVWLDFWGLIGIGSYIYTLVAPLVRGRTFTVSAVDAHPLATTFSLAPDGRALRLYPGQFAFFAPRRKGVGEPHPFTVAGSDDKGNLKVSIRPLGDFTRRIGSALSVGDKVRVTGGHGGFRSARGGDRQIWLAGGIGITPFLAHARNMPDERPGRAYHLVHCVADESEALGRDEFEALAAKRADFSYFLHVSKSAGRISADTISSNLPFASEGADLWFCGPTPMRRAIENGFAQAGVKLARVEFERFEFR